MKKQSRRRMENQVQEEYENYVEEIYRVVWSRLSWIIIIGVICGVIAGGITNIVDTPMYTSTSKLFVPSSSSSSFSSLTDLQFGSQLTNDYAELVKTRPVVEKIIKKLELSIEYEELLSYIEFSNPSGTRVFKISVTHKDPKFAKKVANAFAKATSRQISKIMDVAEPDIVEKAYVDTTPTSSNMLRNMVFGFLAGIIGSILFIICRYVLDDRIKTKEDIERHLQINLLALIPISKEE